MGIAKLNIFPSIGPDVTSRLLLWFEFLNTIIISIHILALTTVADVVLNVGCYGYIYYTIYNG